MSTLGPLATLPDLADFMQAEITDLGRAESMLVGSSSAVRVWCRQEFTRRESTERSRTVQGRIELRQRPVLEIVTVQDILGADVTYTWEGLDEIDVGTNWSMMVINGPNAGRAERVLDVTYDHGYDLADMPDEVTYVVLQAAARSYGLPAEESALTSVSVDGYSEGRNASMVGGAVQLLQEEKDLLAAAGYRRTVSTLQLQGPDYRFPLDRWS